MLLPPPSLGARRLTSGDTDEAHLAPDDIPGFAGLPNPGVQQVEQLCERRALMNHIDEDDWTSATSQGVRRHTDVRQHTACSRLLLGRQSRHPPLTDRPGRSAPLSAKLFEGRSFLHAEGVSAAPCVDDARGYSKDQRMTADDSNVPAEREPQPPREMPLRKMWLFGAFGAVGAITAVVIAPTNPGGWILLASLGGLAWLTRVELRRRSVAQQSDERP
uniref:Uncharacterized protein n=1 Tax=Salinispora arenicola (strain CNS-205) TaxID=391037 RepID=A8LZ05_SALAI